MNPVLISSGEPAGIGPDLCLSLARYGLPIVILGDKKILEDRAKELNQTVQFIDYKKSLSMEFRPDCLTVLSVSCPNGVKSGQLNYENAPYVIELLKQGATLCARKEFSALVTAPVHKANINAAGIRFTGHTEFLADFFQAEQVVMMLACKQMRVALVTTHIPLRAVADSISSSQIIKIISELHHSLINDFGISKPKIKVAGLNPHAGESGYLGREEIEIINPALSQLKRQDIAVEGPYPADTLFASADTKDCDAYVAMYHDQGLPVLKYAGFNQSVNVTLGLPIIRTSVDHGTALELAGKHKANTQSMFEAVKMALSMASMRKAT